MPSRKYRVAHREKGLCADCGAPSPEHYRCQECRQARNVTLQAMRYDAKASSSCIDCGSPVSRFLRCQPCRRVVAKRTSLYRAAKGAA